MKTASGVKGRTKLWPLLALGVMLGFMGLSDEMGIGS
jgi:hypothetical protein